MKAIPALLLLCVLALGPIGELSRLSLDYQFKNRPSFNDDAVNGRLNLTWAIEF